MYACSVVYMKKTGHAHANAPELQLFKIFDKWDRTEKM